MKLHDPAIKAALSVVLLHAPPQKRTRQVAAAGGRWGPEHHQILREVLLHVPPQGGHATRAVKAVKTTNKKRKSPAGKGRR